MKSVQAFRLFAISLGLLFLTASAAQAQVRPTLFGMGVVQSNDMPKVNYAVLSHPPLAWTSIEGVQRGTFDFSTIDQFVDAAPKDTHGTAQVDIVMGWTPGWAVSSTKNCAKQKNGLYYCTVPPDNLQDWTDFITAVADHYNGVTAPRVQFYEIWNEANTQSFWTGTVAELVAMAKLAYPILKKNGFSSVFTPSVTWTPNGTTWMSQYLSGGGNLVADGVSFHAYPSKTTKGVSLPIPLPESSQSTNMQIQSMAAAYRTVANANGMSNRPLITTEGGWGVNGVSDPDMQAAWITHFEILMAGQAQLDNILFQTWYTWGHALSGTIETTAGDPTEAGLAYDEVMTWLVGQPASPCTSNGSIWSCTVGRNVIVWNTSQTCSNGVCTTQPYTAPRGYVKYEDLTGAIHPIGGQIALGVKPIMLEP
jgi:hypothetical protein